MVNETIFDAVDEAFDAIAHGKQRIKVQDFVAHFRKKEQAGYLQRGVPPPPTTPTTRGRGGRMFQILDF